MPNDLRDVMSQVIAQLCSQVGFDRITQSSLEVLIDIAERYIRNIGLQINRVSELCDEPTGLTDGLVVLQLLGQSPQVLSKFLTQVGPSFTPAPTVNCGPLLGKFSRHLPREEFQGENETSLGSATYCSLNHSTDTNGELLQFSLTLSELTAVNPQNPENLEANTVGSTAQCSSTTNSGSSATAGRKFPAWAGQASYRLTRISIDTVTDNIVEHAPPERIPDPIFESPIELSITRGTVPTTKRDTLDKLNASTTDYSSSCRQGSSDAQWAAALQATSVSQPTKRVVYAPTRFDPSSLPTPVSSSRRSLVMPTTSSLNKRSSAVESSSASTTQRSIPNSRVAMKVSNLSTSSRRRRRGSFGSIRRWPRKPSMKKLLSPVVKRHPSSSDALDVESKFLSPSSEKTPPLRTETRQMTPVSSLSPSPEHVPSPVRISCASDDTPPAESPLGALRLRKSDQSEECGNFELEADVDVTVTPIQTNDDRPPMHYSPRIPILEDTDTVVTEVVTTVPPPVSPHLSPVPSVTQIVSTNTSSAFVALHKRRAGRGKRRGRDRRRPLPSMSIMNSLFQNPLRQKPSLSRNRNTETAIHQPYPSKSVPDARVPLETVPTQLEPVPTIINGNAKDTASKRDYSSQSRKRRRFSSQRTRTRLLSRSSANCTENIMASDVRSPNSDCTEPMIDENRARLLEITEPTTVGPTKSIAKPQETEFNSVQPIVPEFTFSGLNFGAPRTVLSKASESLPSSPSSLDSSLSSSISAISTPGLNGPRLVEQQVVKPLEAELPPLCTEKPRQSSSNGAQLITSLPESSVPSHASVSPSTSSLTSSSLSSVNTDKPTLDMRFQPPQLDALVQPSIACPPPPLLPLTNKMLDIGGFRNRESLVPTGNSTFVLPPPILVSVEGRIADITSSTPKPMDNTSNLGLLRSSLVSEEKQTHFSSSSLVKEASLASSLSPSSSTSSSLSSTGSTPNSPYCATGVHPEITTVEDKTDGLSRVSGASSGVIVPSIEPPQSPAIQISRPPVAKTPKIVIRLGGATGSGNASCVHSVVERSTVSVADANRSKPSQSHPTPPPSLKLTISRDRLSYRGNNQVQMGDSNGSSSSESESLLSSGDDDEDELNKREVKSSGGNEIPTARVPDNRHLPPPPSLEQLPNPTTANFYAEPARHPPKIEKIYLTNRLRFKEEAPTVEINHKELPSLLPLITSAPKTENLLISTSFEDTAFEQSSSNRSESSRRSSGRKHKSSLPHRKRHAHEEPVPRTILSVPSLISNPTTPLTSRTRLRVDSVFTDDEADFGAECKDDSHVPCVSNTDAEPHAKLLLHRSHKTNISLATSTDNPCVDDKRIKGRPRTKHTADAVVTAHAPVIKPEVPRTPRNARSKEHSKNKPIIPTSIATSSPRNRKLPGPHRQTSQVVVASAGSSYYFNNSGEQIWLCPVCMLEDDGNLMIGCDSCDDWYHSTCLGLSGNLDIPQWFCPKCCGKPIPKPSYAPCLPAPLVVQPLSSTIKSRANGPIRKRKTHR